MFAAEARYFCSFTSHQRIRSDEMMPLEELNKSESEEQEEPTGHGHAAGELGIGRCVLQIAPTIEQDWGSGREVAIFRKMKEEFPTLRIVDTLQIAGTKSGELPSLDMKRFTQTIECQSRYMTEEFGLTLLVVRKGLVLSNLIQYAETKEIEIRKSPLVLSNFGCFRFHNSVYNEEPVNQSYYLLIANTGIEVLSSPTNHDKMAERIKGHLQDHLCVSLRVRELIALYLLTEFSIQGAYAVIPDGSETLTVAVNRFLNPMGIKEIRFGETVYPVSIIGCTRFI